MAYYHQVCSRNCEQSKKILAHQHRHWLQRLFQGQRHQALVVWLNGFDFANDLTMQLRGIDTRHEIVDVLFSETQFSQRPETLSSQFIRSYKSTNRIA